MAISGRVLFFAEHCLADGASGAAVSAVEMLGQLRARGWDVAGLCGDKVDGKGKPPTGEEIRRLDEPEERVAVHHLTWRGVPMRIVRPDAAAGDVDERLVPLLKAFERELRVARPEAVLTFGGGWFGRASLKLARAAGVPTVFWLRNTSYENKDLFDDVTGTIIVPSMFAVRHYAQTLGLRCDVLYSTVQRDRVRCPVRQPTNLTFVAPLPEKGVYLLARVLSELARRRPDIDVLLVEGRGDMSWFGRTGLDTLGLPNVRQMARTDDPRQFLAVTRALIMPSLWEETFGRTALEGMLSGVPTIGSNRGGIPEVVGTGGVLLPVPERLTRDYRLLATVDEAKPWVDAIVRLWDDEDGYRAMTRAAVASAGRFDPDVLTGRAETLLAKASEVRVSPTGEALDEIVRAVEGPAGAIGRWDGLDAAQLDRLLAE